MKKSNEVHCPKCRQPIVASGELAIDGHTLAVYQCDTCTKPWQFDGDTFDVALTFALDQDGQILDGETGLPLAIPPKPSTN